VLNFIYYPVSAILWFWHEVFGFLFGAGNGFAWMLSVIFLVCTLRALLIKPFISQVRSMRKMQEFQPQIKKLQEKYKGDRTKLAEEMQKLQKEHGVNPLGGCLPVLVQLPVFIGLFHVLRGFQPTYPYNYVFDRADIESFLNADLFGVRLSDAIAGGGQALGQFAFNFGDFQAHVIPVALPLMILAAVATHFTARVSQQHQSAAAAANPQAAIMGKITMWLFPIGLLIFGAFFPVAILIYFLSNNTWTLTQQWLVYRKIAREEEQKKEQAREQRDLLAPRPGQKPAGQKPAPGQKPVRGQDRPLTIDAAPVDEVVTTDAEAPAGATRADGGGRRHPGKVRTGGRNGSGNGAGNASGNGSTDATGDGATTGAAVTGSAGNGAAGHGAAGNGAAGAGSDGAAGNGSPGNGAAGGSARNGAKGGAKGGSAKGTGRPAPGKVGGKGSGQVASSNRPGKKSKKRR
jgi:YidC/Oxa1 family membrane protein insertase